MLKTEYTISKAALGKKLGLSVLLAALGFAAFATLGDGKSKKDNPRKSLLTNKMEMKPGRFSLQSGYSFRGSQVINPTETRYINLNTMASYQQGPTTYILPLKKKIALNGKIVFNPNAASRY